MKKLVPLLILTLFLYACPTPNETSKDNTSQEGVETPNNNSGTTTGTETPVKEIETTDTQPKTRGVRTIPIGTPGTPGSLDSLKQVARDSN